eukprot:3940616-Rhodomonas_salina.1
MQKANTCCRNHAKSHHCRHFWSESRNILVRFMRSSIGYASRHLARARACARSNASCFSCCTLPPKVKHKKPHFQCELYQECGFLKLSLQCRLSQYRTSRSRRVGQYAVSVPDIA